MIRKNSIISISQQYIETSLNWGVVF
jgi:hypothetical protein